METVAGAADWMEMPLTVSLHALSSYNGHFERHGYKELGMVDERTDRRELNLREWLPWTELFRTFRIAIDPKKLLLAAMGIVVMSAAWWLLSLPFTFKMPVDTDYQLPAYIKKYEDEKEASRRLREDMLVAQAKYEVNKEAVGKLSEWPWDGDRGPNPYMVVTNQASLGDKGILDWFVHTEAPVLFEPLVKFLRPLVYFFRSGIGFWNSVYFLLAILIMAAVWAFFGGAITRMAVVEYAQKEKISLGEAVRYTCQRYLSYLMAPLFPLAFVFGLAVLMILFGLVHLIPVVGDLWDGLLLPVVLGMGLLMGCLLVGLVSWPMMTAHVSAEGSDPYEAFSRTYGYIYSAPWHYVWYGLVAIVYGAVLTFVVGFMGSLMVHLSKWGLSQTPGVQRLNRDPAYLFVYAPQSFEWRTLLLSGSFVDGQPLVEQGKINQKAYNILVDKDPTYVGKARMEWYNKVGAFLVMIWLYLVFLLILGFGYSYFWTSSSLIFLLMRQKVDDVDLDEVYMEEEEMEEPFKDTVPLPTPAAPTGGPSLAMVEPPTLRAPASPPAPAAIPLPLSEGPTETDRPNAPLVETPKRDGGDGQQQPEG